MPRLGVLGTLVWDTIRPAGRRDATVEDWGGIAYSLAAFSAIGPEGWTLVPMIKIGADLRERADRFLRGLARPGSTDGLRTVSEPNNRVELRYHDPARRCETLTGGVPAWDWPELRPLVLSCDALYVNFIAGWEIGLGTARELRAAFRGPVYSDLHSLMLGTGDGGVRRLRPLADTGAWLACFDFVQVNEEEIRILTGREGDPLKLAEALLAEGPGGVLVTLGAAGAVWAARERFTAPWGAGGEAEATAPRAVRRGRATPEGSVGAKTDPTGCGDVWGMSCFAAWLGGARLDDAVRAANRNAARKLGTSGTARLEAVLREASAA
ncbi:MAG: PfkB family carbohydrate kinase [Gemmatimonadota bacterium]